MTSPCAAYKNVLRYMIICIWVMCLCVIKTNKTRKRYTISIKTTGITFQGFNLELPALLERNSIRISIRIYRYIAREGIFGMSEGLSDQMLLHLTKRGSDASREIPVIVPFIETRQMRVYCFLNENWSRLSISLSNNLYWEIFDIFHSICWIHFM